MNLKPLSLSRVYRLLEPGPVVLLATTGPRGPNVMTMSWHTMMDFDPPLIGCVVGEGSLTFRNLGSSKECVIAIPTVTMSSTMVKVGNCSGRKMNKILKFGIKTRDAGSVRAPLLPQCWANIECLVHDTSMARRYNFFVLKAVKAWIDPSVKDPKTLHHCGRGIFKIDGKTLRLPSRMK